MTAEAAQLVALSMTLATIATGPALIAWLSEAQRDQDWRRFERGIRTALAKAMQVAGYAAQVSAIAGDAIEAVEADSSAMSAALGMRAGMAAAQMASDAIAMAMGALMGKDPAAPPGSLGAILLGVPNVLIGGFPMPSWMAVAQGLMKLVKGLKKRGKGSAGKRKRGCP